MGERKKLPPNPERMNGKRSVIAGKVLQYFVDSGFGYKPQRGSTTEERVALIEQNLSDLLSDFGHYCDRNDVDMQEVIRRATNHYNEETDRKGVQFTISN